MKKRSKILSGLMGGMLAVIVVVPFGGMIAKANNHNDIPYHFQYNGSGVLLE